MYIDRSVHHIQPTKEKLKLVLDVLGEDKNFIALIQSTIYQILCNSQGGIWPCDTNLALLYIIGFSASTWVSTRDPIPQFPQLPDIFVSLIVLFVALSSAIVSEFAHDALKWLVLVTRIMQNRGRFGRMMSTVLLPCPPSTITPPRRSRWTGWASANKVSACAIPPVCLIAWSLCNLICGVFFVLGRRLFLRDQTR